MTVEDSRLMFPFLPEVLLEPPAEFAELRGECPVARVGLPTGDQAWLVTRLAAVRQVLADPRLSRAATTAEGTPRLGPARPEPHSIMAMDPPEHTRLRRLVAPVFSTGATERLRPRVQQLTDGLLDTMAAAGPPADLITHLAQPLPMAVICEMLGLPEADHPEFRELTDASLGLSVSRMDEVVRARDRLQAYLTDLVATRRAMPGDDVLSTLDADGPELVALGSTLITAGYHTVSSTIGNATLALLRHPDQADLLRADPALLSSAVEELLRYTPGPVSGGTMRIATEDLEIDGTRIRAGEAVIPSTTSANRDASVFADPDRLDLARTPNPHVAFGPGIHHCLGAHLARIQLRSALGTLLRRFPGLALAVPIDDLRWTSGMIRGLTRLPVRW